MFGSTASDSIELVIDGRPRDLGGFTVKRVLPAMKRRLVGPFIFFDHMGPTSLPVGQGVDVRPHPHIGLATVTYLFDGELVHRDSLGTVQTIRPGDVNWMIAGRGIVHSERSGAEAREKGARLHGIQSWVALPVADEETAPCFEHHPAASIPKVALPGVSLEVIAGRAYGATSPVSVLSPTFYVHANVEDGAQLPLDDGHEERCVYVVEGAIELGGETFSPGMMAVVRPGAVVRLTARGPARIMMAGGAKLDGTRHVDWNFVASSPERIERARDDWRNDRFEKVPGDDERIPLPERINPSERAK